jgi:hypothetical protein
MLGRNSQTWTVEFDPGDKNPTQQPFFLDLPAMEVQVERLLEEPRIKIVCTFYKGGGEPPLTQEIQPRDPPFVTTATGLTVEATPLDYDSPTKVEEVNAQWPFSPIR